ncbi:hypothetical protein ASD79_17950 [Caulobacter sp. Root655]|nr:hypothetical protein ASD79_17950 [Caulobacter sp. Root655]
MAATSATVGVISLSIAAVLAKYPAPIEKAAPVTVVASPVEKPQISATQKPSELSIGKDRLPDEPSKLQPKPKVESSKKEDLAEARKATEEKITKTQAAVVPNYTWDIPWESYPNRSWLQREKSDAAKSAGIAGTATVSCILAPNGRIWTECKITDEIPAGYGFGATMIKFVQASTLKADYGFVTRVGSKPFPLTMTFPIE